MLDENFCSYLEFYLSEVISHTNISELRGFWCDGIYKTESDASYLKKRVNDKRQMIFKAHFGTTGQEEYTLIMNFGKRALSRFARDLDIKECLPEVEQTDWYKVDVANKIIEIQLN